MLKKLAAAVLFDAIWRGRGSAVRASGFRESAQFDLSGKPACWVCSDHALGAILRVFGPGLAAKPKSRSDSLLMDVSSFLSATGIGRTLEEGHGLIPRRQQH